MRPYKGTIDITLNAWNGLYYWAGVWHVVCDSDGRPIRFVAWQYARDAAKREHRRTPRATVA